MTNRNISALQAEVDRYLREAEAIKYNLQPELMLDLAQRAAVIAQQLGDVRRYATALQHQAWAYVTSREYEQSLSHALEALSLAREFHLLDTEAYLVNTIAMNFQMCGITKEAAFLLDYQLSLGEQLQDNIIQAIALNDYGIYKMYSEQDKEAALPLFKRAAALLPLHDVRTGLMYQNLAMVYLHTGHLEEALEHAHYVLTLPDILPALRANTHISVAQVYILREDYEAAYREIDLAQEAALDAGPGSMMGVDRVKAHLLLLEGRHAEAGDLLENIYTLSMERHEFFSAIDVLNQLKVIYEHAQNTEKLIDVYRRLADDIPQHQKKTDELRMAVLRMIFARDKAALAAELQLSQQKAAVLNRLSHEFRTPLAIIQASANTLDKYAERLTAEQRQRRLANITDQIEWMTTMLDDILELLRIDDDSYGQFTPVNFELDGMVQSALGQINQYKEVNKSRVKVHQPPPHTVIYGARAALESIMVHLLTNAIKYSMDDVDLGLDLHDQLLTMQVCDRGIGIPAGEQKRVFDLLVRGSNLNEVTGNGIGLTIVKQLVERLRGRIDLHSVEGEGTTVTVVIPLPQTQSPEGYLMA